MEQHIIQWFEAVGNRFENMSNAHVDKEGFKRLLPVLERLADGKYITTGECEYLYDRFHPRGKYPDYNTRHDFHLKYGDVPTMPITDILKNHACNKHYTHTDRFFQHFPNLYELTDRSTFKQLFQIG